MEVAFLLSKLMGILSDEIRNATSIGQFKSLYKKAFFPTKKSLFSVSDWYGIRLLVKLRVQFSDLRSHRFRHRFNCSSSCCKCNMGEETTEHYLLWCPQFSVQRNNLLTDLSTILNNDTNPFSDSDLSNILLYGDDAYNNATNKHIIEATIKFIKTTKRFNILEAFENQ
jgi:hypothetical protein